jgi:hypothetical protein
MVPFQTHVEVTLGVGTEGQNGAFQVPKDKRLVIEYISGEGFVPAPQHIIFGLICTASGNQVRHYLGSNTVGSFGGQSYFWNSGMVKFYADPGTIVTLRVDRDHPENTAIVRMSLSGYLEKV